MPIITQQFGDQTVTWNTETETVINDPNKPGHVKVIPILGKFPPIDPPEKP